MNELEKIAQENWEELMIENWIPFAVISEVKSFKNTISNITQKSNIKKLDLWVYDLLEGDDLSLLNMVLSKELNLTKWGIHVLELSDNLRDRLSSILWVKLQKQLRWWSLHNYSPIKFFELIKDKKIDLEKFISKLWVINPYF